MFDKLQQAFWKALTPDLIKEDVVAAPGLLSADVQRALGGADNLESQQRVALTRFRVQLRDATKLDAEALKAAGVPAAMVLAGGVVHLLTGLNSI